MTEVTIDKVLLQHAGKSPDSAAVSMPGRMYSWRELSTAVSAYAAAFAETGLPKGCRIVAIMEPCFEAVALLCAASRCGIIWVPSSPENPPARIQAVIDSVQPLAIIATSPEIVAGVPRVPQEAAVGCAREQELVWENLNCGERLQQSDAVLEIDPAYIIFTSGSTGKPKGLVLTHRAACAFFRALICFNKLPAGTVVGSIAPIQFDFWLLDTAAALGSGGTLAFIPRLSFFQPSSMARHMRQLGVNQMNGVPSIWTSLLRHAREELAQVTTLQSVFYAGDSFPTVSLRQLQELFPLLRAINCFGHSESIACSFADVPNPIPAGTEKLSFGRGHIGVELLNIDEQGQRILEPHRTGELYLRAPNLFSGYWADPGGTAKALVANPVAPNTCERVFKTGDLVHFDEAGNYYFDGRVDEQVKIMGNRVELGDVAATVRRMPGVRDAVALAEHSPDSPCALLLFVLAEKDSAVTPSTVRSFCLETLPKYMLPGEVDVLDSFPLTGNGKIDTRRLRDQRVSHH